MTEGKRFSSVKDETLTPSRLAELATGDDPLIENFSEDCATGASYDFRAGEKVVEAVPGEEEHSIKSLQDQEEIIIRPGVAYTFYSREKVNIPDDIQGRLSLKFELAAKKLFYSGGLIDPGYSGYLFFTIFNLSSSNYKMKYKEEIAAGEFKQIGSTDSPYKGEEMDALPQRMLPKPPDFERPYRNTEQMNSLLSEHNENINEIRNKIDNIKENVRDNSTRVDNVDGQLNNLMYAAIASMVAGIFAGLTIQIWSAFI
jgi:deoxycytidine triphosphate deaminase